jgi:hypothetical protein
MNTKEDAMKLATDGWLSYRNNVKTIPPYEIMAAKTYVGRAAESFVNSQGGEERVIKKIGSKQTTDGDKN